MVELEAVAEITADDVQRIENLLNEHGAERGFRWDKTLLNVILREDDGRALGGLTGKAVQGWFYVANLAVAPELRGQGWGRKLLLEGERLARDHGCHGVWLDTHSFQAPGFYEKLGYQRFGVLEDFPIGEQRIFYFKRL